MNLNTESGLELENKKMEETKSAIKLNKLYLEY